MLELLVVSLAVFAAWEFLLPFVPSAVPGQVLPLLVGGLAWGSAHIPDEFLYAGAVAGAVALLHVLARHLGAEPEPISIRLPRRSRRVEESPRGVGKRIPSLP